MLSWLMNRQFDKFENELDYDMTYGRDLLAASPRAALLFFRATGLGKFREGLPDDAWHAARLVAARHEDCGPCTQLMATMAERDGISPEVVSAVLQHDFEAMPDDVALSSRFVDAVLNRDPAAEELRPVIAERFGQRGLVSLAFAMLAARMYPTLKYALGHGRTCSVVHVGGAPVLTTKEAI